MDRLKPRGGAAIAALGLAGVLSAAAIELAVFHRLWAVAARHRSERTIARAEIFARALAEQPTSGTPGEEFIQVLSVPSRPSDLCVRISWRRVGGVWRATAWAEGPEWRG